MGSSLEKAQGGIHSHEMGEHGREVRTMAEAFARLTPAAKKLVLDDIETLKKSVGENPEDVLAALPFFIANRKEVLGGAKDEAYSTTAYETGGGSHADIVQKFGERLDGIKAALTKKQPGGSAASAHH